MPFQKPVVALALVSCFLITGCLSPKKLNAYVADQYNNTLPKQEKLKNPDITVSNSMVASSGDISTSIRKTSKVLPLIVYWQYDYRHTCTLNPAMGVNNFIKTVNSQANKGLTQKLNGQKLELSVEEVPNIFALVDKGHIIFLLVYAINWHKLFVEPDSKNLIVSYKTTQDGATVKSGKIVVPNAMRNQNIRFFQSWRSATSEFLTTYNQGVTTMAKNFVDKLLLEL